jgi:DNA-binding transcriptional MerR regulator
MNKVSLTGLTKLYYTIGEVAALFEVNTSLIRFWEKEFQIITPKKNRKGNRLFSIQDIENLNKIYFLVKVKGYTLDGAKNELQKKNKVVPELLEKNPPNNQEIVKTLEAIKTKLIFIKQSLKF